MNYLQEVTRDLISTINWLRKIEKDASSMGRTVNRIPIWNNIDEDNDYEDLTYKIQFSLKVVLKWDKVESLEIIPHISERMVKIRNIPKNTIIKILKDEKKIIIREGGRMIYQAPLILYSGFLSIEIIGNTRPIDQIKHLFIERYEKHLNILLINLRTQLIQSTQLYLNPTFNALSKDSKYKKSLRDLRNILNGKL